LTTTSAISASVLVGGSPRPLCPAQGSTSVQAVRCRASRARRFPWALSKAACGPRCQEHLDGR
jgi:hypothetical protein